MQTLWPLPREALLSPFRSTRSGGFSNKDVTECHMLLPVRAKQLSISKLYVVQDIRLNFAKRANDSALKFRARSAFLADMQHSVLQKLCQHHLCVCVVIDSRFACSNAFCTVLQTKVERFLIFEFYLALKTFESCGCFLSFIHPVFMSLRRLLFVQCYGARLKSSSVHGVLFESHHF